MTRPLKPQPFDPSIVLAAYRSGFFPMAESRSGPIAWFSPDPRAILPLGSLNIPRSLRREMRRSPRVVTIDRAFERVIRECAEGRHGGETWISDDIIRVYTDLHRQGIAHSVETWHQEDLVGGLYGLAIGAVFFGESMFSREPNASKMALVHLVKSLRAWGFRLLDSQIINEHMRQFGAIEIPRADYLDLLNVALLHPVTFGGSSQPLEK